MEHRFGGARSIGISKEGGAGFRATERRVWQARAFWRDGPRERAPADYVQGEIVATSTLAVWL